LSRLGLAQAVAKPGLDKGSRTPRLRVLAKNLT
jgi:hypothetical protein